MVNTGINNRPIVKATVQKTEPKEEKSGEFKPVVASTEPTETVEKSNDEDYWKIPIPKPSKKRLISSGVGGAAGAGLGWLVLGGPWGAVAAIGAGLAVGGATGAVASSETAGNLWNKAKNIYTSRKEKKVKAAQELRLNNESSAKAQILFGQKLEETTTQKFEQRWTAESPKLIDARVDERLASRVEQALDGKVENLFDNKLENVAGEKFEARWDKDGESLLNQEVAKRIDGRLEEEVSYEIDDAVDVAYAQALSNGFEMEMAEREKNIAAEVESQVQKRLAERKAELAEDRQDVVRASQSLETHQNLALDAEEDKVGLSHLQDGLEILIATKGTDQADLALAEKTLAQKHKKTRSKFHALDLAIEVLKTSDEEGTGALSPGAYRDAIANNGEAKSKAKVALLKSGLEVFLDKGSLSAKHKLLCNNALKKFSDIADTSDQVTYLDDVFSVLENELNDDAP